MSYEYAYPPRFARLAELSPDAIEQRLGDLIRHYVRKRSPTTAQSIVVHIEALCSHPEFNGDSSDRCGYLRLRAHWRWLAEGASCRQVAAKGDSRCFTALRAKRFPYRKQAKRQEQPDRPVSKGKGCTTSF